MEKLSSAIEQILSITYSAFVNNDLAAAKDVEPLEQVIDALKERMRDGHITRLKKGECSIEAGFVWADVLNSLERASDHCSNVAVCVIDTANHNMNVHESLRIMKNEDSYYSQKYKEFAGMYL